MAPLARPDRSFLIAAASYVGPVRVWDPDTGKQAGLTLTGHTGPVYAVAALPRPDGHDLVVSGGDDATVRVWDPANGTQIGPTLIGHTGYVRTVATVPRTGQPTLIVSGSADNTILIWESGMPAGILGGQAPATAAVPAGPIPTGHPVPEPAADRGDGNAPAPQPTPAAASMVRVNYTIMDTASDRRRSVGNIDVPRQIAYGDDRTLIAGLTAELRRRGQLPSGTHVAVSPRHPDRPPISWVRYAILDGSRVVLESAVRIDLAKAPADDSALAAVITTYLLSRRAISSGWHVRILEKVS